MTSSAHPGLVLGASTMALLRLCQIHAFDADVRLTTDHGERDRKKQALEGLVAATATLSDSVRLPGFERLAALAASRGRAKALRVAASRLAEVVPREAMLALRLELAVGTSWEDAGSWAGDRADLLALASALTGWPMTQQDVAALASWHHKAVRRLRKDSISTASQLTLGAVIAAATVASGGIAAAAGTFVGTNFLGLSGAAATSAGLAWLGGGSLAAGGLGMAGGMFAVQHATTGAATQAMKFATQLASASATAFMTELAKLDVWVDLQPESCYAINVRLSKIRTALEKELAKLDGLPPAPRRLAADVAFGALGPIPAAVTHLLRATPERNLRTCIRAIDAEKRHLMAPTWKRAAQSAARFTGFPIAARLLG